jgi:hypothetical protein
MIEASTRDYGFIARHANAELRASTPLDVILNRLETYPPRVAYNADRMAKEIQSYRPISELADQVDDFVEAWQTLTLNR